MGLPLAPTFAKGLRYFAAGTSPAGVELEMISLCQPDAIIRLLERPLRSPALIRAVSISSPFIDDYGVELLGQIDQSWPRYAFRLLTRPENAALLRLVKWRRLRIDFLSGLHAKVYSVLGLDERLSEAIVTSANLTRAGLESNVELVVRVTGSTPECAALAVRVDNWTRRVPASASSYALSGRL